MEESHSSWVVIVSSPPCHNHQDWHHYQYHCSLLHPPPLYPMQFVHLLMWTLEDDPSRGSPSSKVTGSSTSSLRSKLANANSTLLFKPLSSENTSHIFVLPFNHSSLFWLLLLCKTCCKYLHQPFLVNKEIFGGSMLLRVFLVPVAALYTPLGDVEEIFNPLGVSLGASES